MSTEQALGYNGPLSTYSEWHSLLIGAAAGLVVGWSRSLRRDVRAEPHYFVGAFLAGVAAGLLWRRVDA